MNLADWMATAKPGDVLAYGETEKVAAYGFWRAGMVALFHRRAASGRWERVAMRLSDRAAEFLDRISASVPAPHPTLVFRRWQALIAADAAAMAAKATTAVAA